MAYKQAPRGNFKKTGHGLPTPFMQEEDYDVSTTAEGVLRAGGYKQAKNLVSKEGGVKNNPNLAAEEVLRTQDSLNTVRKFPEKVREAVGKNYDSSAPKKFSKSEVEGMKKKLKEISFNVKKGGAKAAAEEMFGR
jgi:hypothetical protein